MNFDLPSPVLSAIRRLNEAGFSAYAVGGCVRDWVLGAAPHDYDICTAAKPEETQRVFQGERTVETGLRHGTLTVILEGMPLEITTFRQDGEYLDGRHPESVRFTGRVEEDLARRDFTINAMAYAPGEGLVDPFGGREDCKAGVIRCVGDSETRFSEDALRILRALRFSARLGFPIAENTARAIRKLKGTLDKISRERVAVELTGLLLGKDAAQVLRSFGNVVFAAVPMLAPVAHCPQESIYHAYPLWEHIWRTVDFTPRDEVLRWAALLHDCEKPSCRTRDEQGKDHFPGHPRKSAETARLILRELKMPVRFTDAVVELIYWHDERFAVKDVQEMLVRLGPERLSQLLELRRADQLAHVSWLAEKAEGDYQTLKAELQRLLQENACYTLGQLAVKGKDLAALGLQGPQIGKTLERLLLSVARQETENDREALLDLARSMGNG